ncbi:MAG: acetyl/propionyl/methylcrotonyl-CoA carboxylase subunit alpha [Hyphomicrobiaceae bacterium]
MIRRLLIANRGEIACRIIRTARARGIETVAVFSDADREALHVRLADRAVRLGAAPSLESYLVADRIIAAAHETGADAIHPGYGFLAENADFADAVVAAGLVFVGPSGAAMRALGGKAEAKRLAIAAGVPVIPGYQDDDQDPVRLAAEAQRIGYPVMIKAVAGGGGRGMRRVVSPDLFASELESAQREARSAFGDARVLIEKALDAPRHIEVQVFGDSHGSVVHLFERDCTLQRRNQKVIEEAPAPGMHPDLREAMCEAAVRLAARVGYVGAGTVEFLVSGGELTATAPWFFIEMNTRLQVEHPVTEEITGLDLVAWQLEVASGRALPLRQSEIAMTGHAVEARLCAEDPANGFAPAVGRLASFDVAPVTGLRLETGVASGDEVTPFYDSMIAKLIIRSEDRETAFENLAVALDGTSVMGLPCNARFLRALATHEDVRMGKLDTGLIARNIDSLGAAPKRLAALSVGIRTLFGTAWPDTEHAPSCARPSSPWRASDAFQLGPARREVRSLVVDGTMRPVSIVWSGGDPIVNAVAGLELGDDVAGVVVARRPVAFATDAGVHVLDDLIHTSLAFPPVRPLEDSEGSGDDCARAPINGRVVRVFLTAGDRVAAGASVAVVEAMKMEHQVIAGRDAVIESVDVEEGQQVAERQVIVTFLRA